MLIFEKALLALAIILGGMSLIGVAHLNNDQVDLDKHLNDLDKQVNGQCIFTTSEDN